MMERASELFLMDASVLPDSLLEGRRQWGLDLMLKNRREFTRRWCCG
jgi:hypothetical protein